MDATKSLSYSQESPIEPRDTLTAFKFCGHFFESGEILLSFYGKAKRPDAKKSKCGTKVNLVCYCPSSYSTYMNLPTNGKSTH